MHTWYQCIGMGYGFPRQLLVAKLPKLRWIKAGGRCPAASLRSRAVEPVQLPGLGLSLTNHRT